MPYGFYELVRFAAAAAFAYLSYDYFKSKNDQMIIESIELDIEGYILDYCLFRVFNLKAMDNLMKTYYDLSESRYNDLMYYLMKREFPDVSEKLSETTGSCV